MKRKKKAPRNSAFAAWRFLVGAFLARTLCLEVIQIFASLVSNKARKRLCSVPLFLVHNRQPHCIPNVWQGHTSRWPMELSNANCDSPLARSSPVLSLGRILYSGRPRRPGLALLAAFAGKWPEHNRVPLSQTRHPRTRPTQRPIKEAMGRKIQSQSLNLVTV